VSWQEGVAVAVIVAALGAAMFLVAQRPSFWIEFGARLGKALMPRVIAYLTRRMPEAEEREWHKAIRQGRGDEWLRERWRKRRRK
jgi:hypothetical protein